MTDRSDSRPSPESFVGSPIRTVSLHVEPGKIVEFANALHDTNAAYQRPAAGEPMLAPLTFSVVSALQNPGVGSAATEAVAALGLDAPKVLNGGQEWEYLTPVHAGDVLCGVTTVEKVERRANRRGQSMLLVELATIWRRDEEQVMRETVTIIEVGGQ